MSEESQGQSIIEARPSGALPAEAPEKSPTPRAAHFQLIFVALVVIAYAALSHYSYTTMGTSSLGAFLSIAPMSAIAGVLIWRWCSPLTAMVVFATTALLVFHFWQLITKYYEWSDVAQQFGAYALVSASFAQSLRAARIPVCTQVTARLHGALSPAEIVYTRRATLAWAIFYAAVAAAIVVLFFATSPRIWSLFTNFGTFGLMGMMFMIDHAIRWRYLPRKSASVWEALRQSLLGSFS